MLKMLLILFALTVTLIKNVLSWLKHTHSNLNFNQLESYGLSAAFETTPTTYLWARTLHQHLAHVEHRSQSLNVVPLPQPDGLRQDLQLQFLSLPNLLALNLTQTTALITYYWFFWSFVLQTLGRREEHGSHREVFKCPHALLYVWPIRMTLLWRSKPEEVVRQTHTTAADGCLDTHLHVSLQLL